MRNSCSSNTVCNPPLPDVAVGGVARGGGLAAADPAGWTLMPLTMNPCGDMAKLESTCAISELKPQNVI
jgi:hypothetical protein